VTFGTDTEDQDEKRKAKRSVSQPFSTGRTTWIAAEGKFKTMPAMERQRAAFDSISLSCKRAVFFHAGCLVDFVSEHTPPLSTNP